MTQVVTRTFKSQEQAMAAARELLQAGFPRDRLHLLVHRGGESAEDDIVDELAKIGLGREEAKACARHLKDGQTLLTASPPDLSEPTVEILDRHDPIDAGRVAGETEKASSDPAPLSHALGLKVLSDDPAPLSHLLHIPVLSDD